MRAWASLRKSSRTSGTGFTSARNPTGNTGTGRDCPFEDYKILESVGGTRASNIKPQAYALQPEPPGRTARPTHLPTCSPDRQTREVGATDSKIMESADVTAGDEPLCPTHSEPTRGPASGGFPRCQSCMHPAQGIFRDRCRNPPVFSCNVRQFPGTRDHDVKNREIIAVNATAEKFGLKPGVRVSCEGPRGKTHGFWNPWRGGPLPFFLAINGLMPSARRDLAASRSSHGCLKGSAGYAPRHGTACHQNGTPCAVTCPPAM